MKLKELFNLTGLPILIASLCCLTPVVLVLLGLSTVSFAASLNDFLEGKYRLIFILLGFFTLTTSLFFYFRKKGICSLDQAQRRRNEIINKSMMVIIIAIVGYIIFFYGIIDYLGKFLRIWR